MSKDLVSLIVTVVLCVGSAAWTADPSRPNAIPSVAPRAPSGMATIQPAFGSKLRGIEPNGAI